MPILFACPCGRQLQARKEHAGRGVRCPSCGRDLTVPPGEAGQFATDFRQGRGEYEREEDRPRPPHLADGGIAEEASSGKAVAALVLGLVSLCLGFLTGAPAVILALMGLGDIRRSHGRLGGKGLAVTGLALGCVGTLLTVLWAVGGYFGYARVREAADSTRAQNDLKMIGIAMHNHHDTYGRLPQGEPRPNVQPATKLSWRAQLLPFLESASLYKQLHLDEPWDSPHNRSLLTPMPKVFAHPRHPAESAQGLTYYRVFVGRHTPFPPEGGARIPASFQDGTSNTILVVEAADPVPWTRPDELAYDPARPLPRLGGTFRGGFLVCMADGSTRLVRSEVSERTLRNAIDPADGNELGPDW